MPPTVLESIPEMDTLTAEQTKMVADFVTANLPDGKLPRAYEKDSAETHTITAYKYLTARKWVMADATKMFQDAMAFRESIGFDGNPVFPTPIPIRGYNVEELNKTFGLEPRAPGRADEIYNHVKTVCHFGFHYWDKTGHPVVIDCAGKANVTKLVAKFKELTPPGQDVAQASIDLHMHQNIVGAHLVKFQDAIGAGQKADGRRVTSATVIMDARGLSLGHLFGEAVEITKKSWAQDAAYFPEGMHRMFVVNCPSMIMVAYNLFKGMIDKRTQDKVVFCNEADTPAILKTVIDAKYLPKFLGGECSCEGGCVYNENEAEEQSEKSSAVRTVDITVAAGKSWEKSYTVSGSRHKEIAWQWESATGSDIEFSVTFTPKAEGSKPQTIVPPTKAKTGDDMYVVTESGSVTIKFDNTFSWVNQKQIRVRVAKIGDQGIDPSSPASPAPSKKSKSEFGSPTSPTPKQ